MNLPASIRALTKARECFPASVEPRKPVFPLKDSNGLTWWERKLEAAE